MPTYTEQKKEWIEKNSKTIKRNIKGRGVTLAELAKHFGITPPAMTQLLQGDISLTTLLTIADYCKCSIADLLQDEDDKDNLLVCPKCGIRLKLLGLTHD